MQMVGAEMSGRTEPHILVDPRQANLGPRAASFSFGRWVKYKRILDSGLDVSVVVELARNRVTD